MNDFKTSGCEAPKTADSPNAGFEGLPSKKMGKIADLYGVDYPEKLALERNAGNSIDMEDVPSVVLDCSSVAFLTDCARIELKGESFSEFLKKVKKIIINGVSFAKEGGGE